ncbi:MAG: Lrp/AsnC family transcriptional regulator [Nanoarchaeota archaeon]
MEENFRFESLDLKDKKILFELDFNARMPYSVLGRKVGLSKQGAEYRVQNLIKRGIIKGFYPIVNVPKLGYIYCRLSLTLQNITMEKKKEIVKYLQDNPKVFWLLDVQGICDIFIVIWAKSLTEFREFIEEVENRFGGYIKETSDTIGTDVIHFRHRYLLGKEKTEEIHIAETQDRINIDRIDQEILLLLCEDARISLVNIAQKVKESAKLVAYRIRKMEEKGLIEGYRPIIDHNIIGYTYYKIFISLNNISKGSLKELRDYIKQNHSLIYIVEGIGFRCDLDIELMVKSNQELFKFMEELRYKFPELIGEYQNVVFMNTLKVRYLPF